MSAVHISLLSVEEQKKGQYVFPVGILEGTAVKAEERVFTSNNAKLHASSANGFASINGQAEDCCRLILRPLEKHDYQKGYIDLLKQLTEVGEISPERFVERFSLMEKSPKSPASYYVCVLEDFETQQIVGSASLTLEFKLIRNCGIRGRIEDVVVDKAYRGKHLAKILLTLLVELAKDLNCYKMSLECKDHLVTFYSQFGFIKEPLQNFMSQRFIE